MSKIKIGKYSVDPPYSKSIYFHSSIRIALVPVGFDFSFYSKRHNKYSILPEDIKIRITTVTPHAFGHQDCIEYHPFNSNDTSINGDVLRIYQILDLWKKY